MKTSLRFVALTAALSVAIWGGPARTSHALEFACNAVNIDRTVVVNLAGTTFIDVGGMCSLFEAAGSARDRGSHFYLAGCSAQLVRLLHLADLSNGIDVIPSART